MCIYITSGIHPTRVELAPLPGMASRQPHHVHLWVFWFAYDAWEKLAMVTAGHISFYVFVSNEFKTGPKSPCHCAGDPKKAGLLPQVSTAETWSYITKLSLQFTAGFVCLEVQLECRHTDLKSPSRDHQQCCRKEVSFPVPITQLWAFLC